MRHRWIGLTAVVIGVAVVASGAGVATGAAREKSLLLGMRNKESAISTLKSSAGIPLALRAKAGSPPLRVNSDVVVSHLNAAELDGNRASAFQAPVSTSCAAGIAAFTTAGAATCAAAAVVLTRSQTWTVPAGIHEIAINVTGGGGGGGVSTSSNAMRSSKKHKQPKVSAGGGGEAATATVMVAVSPGEALAITIGEAGAAGSSAGDATPGAATDVYRPAQTGALLVTAAGGRPGRSARVSNGCAAGSGGTASANAVTGVTALSAAAGSPGSCKSGGGVAGFPGAGGSPQHAGSAGVAMITLVS